MITLQEYLDQQYPTQSEKEEVTKISLYTLPLAETNQLAGGKLNLTSYPNLKIARIDGNYLKTKLTKLDLSNCSQLTILDVANNYLTTLDCSKCPYLEILVCYNNQLINLDLSHQQQLEILGCADNYLTQLPILPQSELLTSLAISSNNLSETDCSVFSQLRNLRELYIGNTDPNKLSQGLFNRFKGSCEPLQNCTKLYSLDISQTDLDRGLEYLPASCETIYCANTPLEPYLKGFEIDCTKGSNYSAWRQVNLSLIEQLQENSELLDSITILDSSLAHNNLTPELTQLEKVLQVLRFYLEEENQATRKQLYQAQELVNQIQLKK